MDFNLLYNMSLLKNILRSFCEGTVPIDKKHCFVLNHSVIFNSYSVITSS